MKIRSRYCQPGQGKIVIKGKKRNRSVTAKENIYSIRFEKMKVFLPRLLILQNYVSSCFHCEI